MKKSRMITSALIAASMLVGAGYAAWNKTLTINHSVSIAQDVAVEFVEETQSAYGYDENYNYLPITYSSNATTANFSIEGLRPGSTYFSNINEQNVGSLPAKFDNAVVTISGTQSVIDNMSANLNFWVYDSNGNFKYSLGYVDCTLADFPATLNSHLAPCVLEPGDFITTFKGDQAENYIHFYFSPAAGPDTMNCNVQISIQLNWKQ